MNWTTFWTHLIAVQIGVMIGIALMSILQMCGDDPLDEREKNSDTTTSTNG